MVQDIQSHPDRRSPRWGKVIDALYSLRRKSPRLARSPPRWGSFRSNHQRMRYRETRDTESPIRGGAVKVVNKMIGNTRLKRWGRAGG
ncbi:MAG: hypothetical protein OXC62_17240 [Aestuariivita sp.]|nr:hypothetical protein [Aestuariivita sp.]